MGIKVQYGGRDLGAAYAKARTRFRVWAPTADAVELCLYARDADSPPSRVVPMKKSAKGSWALSVPGNLRNQYFTYRVTANGKAREAVDPYARATGANGLRGQILDLRETDPKHWAKDRKPAFARPTDAVIYELHVRDATIHPGSGVRQRGKYLGLAERPVLDHLRDLGVTHVHLLPVHDYESVDETKPDTRYNWGYDPQNYNVPEGSYATDPHDGRVRIREFKQMVMALHKAGIRVVMDVVYNHTYRAADSNFNTLVPGYYYRQNADGTFSNGSGCGNETASEQPMFRKFMIESLVYWAREYHVDGFRFDLMGLHDLATMRKIRQALDRVDPNILIYGEGWTGGDSPLPFARRAMKTNVQRLRGVAAFNDGIRDALKGPVGEKTKGGFVAGTPGLVETVKAGIVAAVSHPQVKYPNNEEWRGPWASAPGQCITYDSCHDNHTLWDKLQLASPRAPEAERVRMNKLCAAMLLTSQGIVFLHAGEEFLRTKNGEENSYNKPDAVNRLDWPRKRKYRDVFAYYRGLIALRKAHGILHLPTAREIQAKLRFLDVPGEQAVGYAVGDLVLIFNGGGRSVAVKVPGRLWHVLADHRHAGVAPLRKLFGDRVVVPRRSALVLRRVK